MRGVSKDGPVKRQIGGDETSVFSGAPFEATSPGNLARLVGVGQKLRNFFRPPLAYPIIRYILL